MQSVNQILCLPAMRGTEYHSPGTRPEQPARMRGCWFLWGSISIMDPFALTLRERMKGWRVPYPATGDCGKLSN